MTQAWDADELAWARECLAAGDTLEEIAEWSERSLDDVTAALSDLSALTGLQRRVASCIAAGMGCTETDRALGLAPTSAWACVRRIWAKGYHLSLPGKAPKHEVATALGRGLTIHDLAERFGVSARTIQRRRDAAHD